jgi:hypothetical protein
MLSLVVFNELLSCGERKCTDLTMKEKFICSWLETRKKMEFFMTVEEE